MMILTDSANRAGKVGITMGYIETGDGVQLFYKDWGTGRPVVLVHGWCINGDSWES
ncbi:MAG: alpha/beta hydrolase [Armatimonadota bacterium]